ncbi:MAG TPA: 50S ribosomal protein L24 [Pyrinomonadaceae bacterium]|jgi:large subunit ribosomal protein L24
MKEVKKGTIRSKIKRGDTVVFISGREFNRYEKSTKGGQEEVKRVPLRGEVIEVDPRKGKVKVGGAQIMKRHRKAVPQMNVEGGIIESEGWVDISNVAVVDPKTGKPTRVKYEMRDGKKVRVAKSGELIPDPPRRTNTKKKDNDNE